MSVVIIPARLGSTRLPGKMLADVGGLPLVVRVMHSAQQAKRVSRVIVATADAAIADVVRSHGGEVGLTADTHGTGTDRVAEIAADLDAPHIINVQGDNLGLSPDIIDRVAESLETTGAPVVTAVTPFPVGMDVADPSKVKAVLSESGQAVYFSRQPVPSGGPWWLHIGIYGFRRDTLMQFSAWAPSGLEKSERLEQLRLLAHGIEIHTVGVASGAASIDTPADLALARSHHSSSSHLRH